MVSLLPYLLSHHDTIFMDLENAVPEATAVSRSGRWADGGVRPQEPGRIKPMVSFSRDCSTAAVVGASLFLLPNKYTIRVRMTSKRTASQNSCCGYLGDLGGRVPIFKL